MHYRPHPGKSQPSAHVDGELLADAQVEHPFGVVQEGLLEVLLGDVGEDERDRAVSIEKVGRGRGELLTHGDRTLSRWSADGLGHAEASTSATTKVGDAASVGPRTVARAAWS